MSGAPATAGLAIRDLVPGDLDAVVRLDALHTGRAETGAVRAAFEAFLARRGSRSAVGLAAERDGRLVGYLLGEVRAFEFGSEPCGWVFAVGVEPAEVLRRVGTELLGECGRRFRGAGVGSVRTMVPRGDVPLAAFFRSNGFVAGSFVQLELALGPGAGPEGGGR